MIDLRNVSYSYGTQTILNDCSLTLAPGSFQFLTGPSGAGKTTLLKLCYFELSPSGGIIDAFGVPTADMSRDQIAINRRRVGLVHQNCQFLDHLSLWENVALPLTVSGQMDKERAAEMTELLTWVGLGEKINALPPQLSGGERQRAALARAVIMSPEVILADEPTGNLDWEMSLRLLRLLIELNKMGKAVLIATHDLNLIRQAKTQISARIIRLKSGRLSTAGADL